MATDSLKEYEKLKKQLQQAILKKKSLDKQITQIEEDIFQKETVYLSESNNSNIVRGFESLNKMNPTNSINKKKLVFTDDDRIFSLSSHTFVRHLQKKSEMDEDEDDSNEGTPAANSSTTTAGTSTKKRKRADD